jgi:hypothetical protein
MGEYAEMCLDGTMDPETGEFNFDGEDGPGFPMTGAQAAEYRRSTRFAPKGPHGSNPRNARRRAKKRAAKAAGAPA